jgi:hypothetical protein
MKILTRDEAILFLETESEQDPDVAFGAEMNGALLSLFDRGVIEFRANDNGELEIRSTVPN